MSEITTAANSDMKEMLENLRAALQSGKQEFQQEHEAVLRDIQRLIAESRQDKK